MDQQGRQGQSQDNNGHQSHAKNVQVRPVMLGNPTPALVIAPSPVRSLVQSAGGTMQVNSNQPSPDDNMKHEMEIRRRLRTFWDSQILDIRKMSEFKNHSLPLARIKKIMKADEDVKMISAEAPMVFAKACEMFILELTYRSWYNTEENKRRTLLKSDVTHAITRTDIFDFLVDIVPRDEPRPDDTLFSVPRVAIPHAQAYFRTPPQQPAHPAIPGEIMNPQPAVDPNMFRQNIPMAPVFWFPQPQPQPQQNQDQEEQQQHQSGSDS